MTTAAQVRHEFLTPVGRYVGGDLYQPKTTNSEGDPLVFKTDGKNHKKGDGRVDYYFALAIPKDPAHPHWGTIPGWGVALWAAGHALGGNLATRPDFAWKVEDGDSQIPNLKDIKPCDREGYPGHWVLHLGSGSAPRIVNADGSKFLLENGAVKRGYYVQAHVNVNSNGSTSNPGIFLNHSAVSLQGFGPEIVFGPNVAAMGFGGAALPPGASTVPVAQATAPGSVPAAPAAPQAPGAPTPPPAPQSAAPAAPSALPAPPAAPPAPNTAFVENAGAAGAPAMTALAGATTYAAYKAANWTDEQLIAGGYMLAPQPAAPAAPSAPPSPPAPPAPPTAPAEPSPGPNMPAGGTYAAYKAANWTDEQMRASGIIV